MSNEDAPLTIKQVDLLEGLAASAAVMENAARIVRGEEQDPPGRMALSVRLIADWRRQRAALEEIEKEGEIPISRGRPWSIVHDCVKIARRALGIPRRQLTLEDDCPNCDNGEVAQHDGYEIWTVPCPRPIYRKVQDHIKGL